MEIEWLGCMMEKCKPKSKFVEIFFIHGIEMVLNSGRGSGGSYGGIGGTEEWNLWGRLY